MALCLLPRRRRRDLLALYGFARLADELGDALAGDRLAALDALEAELDRACAGRARHPLVRRLDPLLRERGLPRDPFVRLIDANRRDQVVRRYATWEELLGYCALSASPLGELVLHVFGAATPERIALSDAICTALQVIEHCQDVAEDRARDRIYLPLEDRERCGCGEDDLARAPASAPLRSLLALEAGRARALLRRGEPLLAQLAGPARWAVAAFAAGGHAALDALGRAGFDPTGRPLRPRRRDLAAHAVRLLLRRRPRAAGAAP